MMAAVSSALAGTTIFSPDANSTEPPAAPISFELVVPPFDPELDDVELEDEPPEDDELDVLPLVEPPVAALSSPHAMTKFEAAVKVSAWRVSCSNFTTSSIATQLGLASGGFGGELERARSRSILICARMVRRTANDCG
jgi:hypothetical protein